MNPHCLPCVFTRSRRIASSSFVHCRFIGRTNVRGNAISARVSESRISCGEGRKVLKRRFGDGGIV
jgi:hypothetical protein